MAREEGVLLFYKHSIVRITLLMSELADLVEVCIWVCTWVLLLFVYLCRFIYFFI